MDIVHLPYLTFCVFLTYGFVHSHRQRPFSVWKKTSSGHWNVWNESTLPGHRCFTACLFQLLWRTVKRCNVTLNHTKESSEPQCLFLLNTFSMTVCQVAATFCPVDKSPGATFRPLKALHIPLQYISHETKTETSWKSQQVIFGFLLASMCCPRHLKLVGQSKKWQVLTGTAQIQHTQRARGQSPEVQEVFFSSWS